MSEDLKKDKKEDFCGACLSVPLALAGAGVAGGGSMSKSKSRKKIMLIVGISVAVIGLIITIWFVTRCKSCN